MAQLLELALTDAKTCSLCGERNELRDITADGTPFLSICVDCRKALRLLLLLHFPLSAEEAVDNVWCNQFRDAEHLFRRAADAEER